MLSFKVRPFVIACAALSGGIARIWVFDPDDFNFTQAAPNAVTGPQPYTAIALRAGAVAADGAKMYPISFSKKGNEASYTYKQSRKGAATKYEHQVEFYMINIGQLIAQWNDAIDAAGACSGVGILIQLNSGKILVAGERWVNDEPIDIPLLLTQDGSSGDSGKLYDDPNGQTTIIKGDAGRSLYEYTGTVASIVALQ